MSSKALDKGKWKDLSHFRASGRFICLCILCGLNRMLSFLWAHWAALRANCNQLHITQVHLSDHSASFFRCRFSETRALGTNEKKLQEMVQVQVDKDLDLCWREECKTLSRKQSRLQWWTVNRGYGQVSSPLNVERRTTFKKKTTEMPPVNLELKLLKCHGIASGDMKLYLCVKMLQAL